MGPLQLIDDGVAGSSPPTKHLQGVLSTRSPADFMRGHLWEWAGGVLLGGLERGEFEGVGGGVYGAFSGHHASFFRFSPHLQCVCVCVCVVCGCVWESETREP